LLLGAVARSAALRVPLSFAAPKSYEAVGESDVRISDLNGDGRPDLVTEGIGATSVLLNKGGGRFGEASYYEVDVRGLGDLNGDGSIDLVAIDGGTGTVSMRFNKGDGTFGANHDYETGLVPADVAIADLNGDGALDLATANTGDDTASVLLNGGHGTLLPHVDLRAGRRPGSIAIRDLNDDGRPDLVVGNVGSKTVSVLLNGGSSFQARSDYATGGDGAVSIADLNRDDFPDLVTTNDKARLVSVLLNRGDGSFQPKAGYRTGPDPWAAIGDLNGDGAPELAVASFGSSTVSVLRNRGDGTFEAKRTFATGPSPFSPEIGDLSGDGRPDLVALNADAEYGALRHPTISVLLNSGGGSFEQKLYYAVGHVTNDEGVTTRALAIGDLNGDGRLDLAATNTYYGPLENDVSVVINRPGLCNVQRLARMTLAAAKQALHRVNCRTGRVRRAYSKAVKKGRVIAQKPEVGTVRSRGVKVDLVISRGRRR
jgi:hypothetical protein